MTLRPESLKSTPKIRLSWKAYYEQFKVKHGQPVLWKSDQDGHSGMLLFSDGWTYSTEGYAGPEYPPPEDAETLRLMQMAYWRIRVDTLRAMRVDAVHRLEALRSVQRGKAIPLRYTRPRYGEENKVIGTEVVDIDYMALGQAIDLIDLDIEDCEAKIEELEPTKGAKYDRPRDHRHSERPPAGRGNSVDEKTGSQGG